MWVMGFAAVFVLRAPIVLNPRGEQALAISAVLSVHALFAFMLIVGVSLPPPNSPDLSLALVGGQPGGSRNTTKFPDLAKPRTLKRQS